MHPPGRKGPARIFLHAALVSLACAVALAGPVLELADGRYLQGKDLRRDGDLFILELKDGSVIPIPTAAVREVTWTEEGQGGGAPTRTLSIVKGRTDEEAREAEERSEARASENDAWAAARMTEMEEDQRREEAEQEAKRIRDDWGYNQPSGLVGGYGWQQNIAGSTQQPSYWVPDPAQSIGNWP